jgi:hypothetical protein
MHVTHREIITKITIKTHHLNKSCFDLPRIKENGPANPIVPPSPAVMEAHEDWAAHSNIQLRFE